jgi:protein involved in polysaccharide export with SLBB domain
MLLVVQVGSATLAPKEMQVMVDQNGEITLPYLLQSPVACDGLGLEPLKQKLVKEYSVYIRQPQVSVTFGPYDQHNGVSPWGTVKVMGEVAQPGPINMPATMDMTVTKVLQVAGGVKPFADKSRILVTRCDKEGRRTRTRIDLREIGEDGRFDKDMVLKAGDVVYVPETWY